jgi:hypothetical protein
LFFLLNAACLAVKQQIPILYSHWFDADFPRLYRLADDDCTGSGFYPSKLQADDISEYWSHGVDLVVQPGDE